MTHCNKAFNPEPWSVSAVCSLAFHHEFKRKHSAANSKPSAPSSTIFGSKPNTLRPQVAIAGTSSSVASSTSENDRKSAETFAAPLHWRFDERCRCSNSGGGLVQGDVLL
eukprot:CAMPEP_0115167428 /NCGR_PEP_ID=MMETSP0270-20121206/212_1 /TAXON_ID=71861 /ORGANISM="Scrippsiella trochoidea, Strain CCMP3099" /LENGTH=109 /DNA_ID=CAMNT_0002580023 /DNA_START=96 /DNA_END=422 /DNA_ORIENTATION=+